VEQKISDIPLGLMSCEDWIPELLFIAWHYANRECLNDARTIYECSLLGQQTIDNRAAFGWRFEVTKIKSSRFLLTFNGFLFFVKANKKWIVGIQSPTQAPMYVDVLSKSVYMMWKKKILNVYFINKWYTKAILALI